MKPLFLAKRRTEVPVNAGYLEFPLENWFSKLLPLNCLGQMSQNYGDRITVTVHSIAMLAGGESETYQTYQLNALSP